MTEPETRTNQSKSPRLPTATIALGGRPGAGPEAGKPSRRRLSNYLLNKSLQLRYIGVVTVLSAVISGSLGYMIWQQETLASSEIVAAMDTSFCEGMYDTPQECSEFRAGVGAGLRNDDSNLLWQMVAVGVGLVVVLVLYLLVMTHKVAGPLYKIARYFERMADGRLSEIHPLRKGDMLMDFYDTFKEMHDAVRSRHQSENALYGRFLDACAAAGVTRSGDLGTALEQLEELHESRSKALA